MINVELFKQAGDFAENKDIARDIRVKTIYPALDRGEEVQLDFTGVDGATQSFIHALLSEVMRKYGIESLDKITFKNCNETVKKIILIVTEYMQESV